MSSGDYLGQHDFQAAVLPARVAYLIRPNNPRGFRRAVAEASTRWGGQTEPIIPVASRGRLQAGLRQIIELANVDELVNIDLPTDRADAIGVDLALPVVPIAQIDTGGPGMFTCHPAAIAIPPPPHLWAYADDSLDLWAITAAGTLRPESIADSSEFSDAIVANRFPDQIARAQLANTTVISRTVSQFRENFAHPPPTATSAIVWICDRRSFNDCMEFWNYRALRSLYYEPFPFILLPEYDLPNWLHFTDQLTSRFRNRPDDFSPDAFLVSIRVQQDRLRAIGDSWGMVESTETPRSTRTYPPPRARETPYTYLVNYNPTPAVIFERRYGLVELFQVQAFRDDTGLRFESPVHFDRGGYVKVQIHSSLLAPFPRRPVVASMLFANATWRDDGLEVNTNALPNYIFSMQFPTLESVLTTLLHDSAQSWELSDKGKIGVGISSRLDLKELLKGDVYRCIRGLTTPRVRHVYQQLQAVGLEDDQSRLQLAREIGGRTDRRFRSSTEIEGLGGSRGAMALESLVALGWVERGLKVECEICGLDSFVQMGEATDDGACPGCHSSEGYALTRAGPTIYYRLNSLIDLASDQGVLPHLLAIASLSASESTNSILPGVNLVLPGGDSEADLFGIHNGRVICGEVKASGTEFDNQQIERDVSISQALKADVHVMAWLGEPPPGAVDHAREAARRRGLDFLPLPLEDSFA